MFPPKKKKPGIDAFPVGKPKSDLDTPSPVDREEPEAPEVEPPAEDASADYGAKLVADIEAVGEQHGMDAATSRAAAGAFLKAAAECLLGDSGEQEPNGADTADATDRY